MPDLSFATSTMAPAGQVTIWVEASDASRHKLADCLNLLAGKEQAKAYVENWVAEGADRKVERVKDDDLSWLLMLRNRNTKTFEPTGVVYIEPLPLRPTHAGDVRIDRKLHPRFPRRAA